MTALRWLAMAALAALFAFMAWLLYDLWSDGQLWVDDQQASRLVVAGAVLVVLLLLINAVAFLARKSGTGHSWVWIAMAGAVGIVGVTTLMNWEVPIP